MDLRKSTLAILMRDFVSCLLRARANCEIFVPDVHYAVCCIVIRPDISRGREGKHHLGVWAESNSISLIHSFVIA